MTAQSRPERIVVTPADTGAGLVNPGMGWVSHHYDNGIRNYGVDLPANDTLDDFPGLSTIYLRLAWSYLEPEEGQFSWSILDTPAQRFIARGKKIALRFTTSETNRDQPYATPQWVEKAGARGYRYNYGKGVDPAGNNWDPDFEDPIYLAKLDRFLEAAAARYDGNPEVAFVDVGTLGAWGEGHTLPSSQVLYSAATVRRHIDLHRKHFRKTLLVVNDDFSIQGRGTEIFDEARSLGMGFRDDSILVEPPPRSWYHAYLAQRFWPTVPVVVECEHYGPSRDSGAWSDDLYVQAIEEYHASYASIHWYPRQFLAERRDVVQRINLRLGYRLQLIEASWPARVAAGSTMLVGYRWRNGGVAPCLPGGHPIVTLKDSHGAIAAVFADEEFNVRALPVDAAGKAHPIGRELKVENQRLPQSARPLAQFRLPPDHILPPGTYSIFISIGTRSGTPTMELPLSNPAADRRYPLGTVEVVAAGAAAAPAPQSPARWW